MNKRLIYTPFLLLALVGVLASPLWAATLTLLSNATTNASGTGVEFPPYQEQGCGNVVIYGTWDTATVTLEHSLDNGSTWQNFEDEDSNTVTCTANCEYRLCVDRRFIRLTVSSVGGSTDLDARIGF